MNAGEVASQIAVTTIAKCFSEANMRNLEMTESAIKKFLRKSIVAADDAIKKAASKDKEKDGMGTTVAMLWMLSNNTAYYAWCGDSRIYGYSPKQGLRMLSRDHSYVMEVLNLTEEEAFEHPNNNIITRSLGNPSERANPDVEGPINLYKDDLFLLCSDGLCGVLRSEEIQTIMGNIPDANHLAEGIDMLWSEAAAAQWHDNVTTLLCQVASGPERPQPKVNPVSSTQKNSEIIKKTANGKPKDKNAHSKKSVLISLLVTVAVVSGIIVFLFLKTIDNKADNPAEQKAATPSSMSSTASPIAAEGDAPSNSVKPNPQPANSVPQVKDDPTKAQSSRTNKAPQEANNTSDNTVSPEASNASTSPANNTIPTLTGNKRDKQKEMNKTQDNGTSLLRKGGENQRANERQTQPKTNE